MSHFTVTVLLKDVPQEEITNRQYIEHRIGELLMPYNENIQVEEYDTECSCIGRVAEREAREVAEKTCGTIDDFRKTYVSSFPDKKSWELTEEEEDIETDAWNNHISEYLRVKDEAFDNHPMKDAPDPTCGFYTGERQGWWPEDIKVGDRYDDDSGCGATGTYKTTYNPKSQWDWYSVGGRWTGSLVGYDPETDSDNWEMCYLCHGSGQRNDMLGMQQRIIDPSYTCNGCQGKGKSLKFTYKDFDGDVAPVSMVKPGFSSYAVVTSDGEWHQRGKMGWWGMSNDEMTKKEWREEFSKLLADNQDCVAVMVDCHI